MERKSPKIKKPNYSRILTAILIVASVLGAIAIGHSATAILFLLINVFGARELCFVLEEQRTPMLTVIYMVLCLIPFLAMYLFELAFNQTYILLVCASLGFMVGLILNLWTRSVNYSQIRYFFTLMYWGLPFSLASYFLIFGGIDVQFMIFGIIVLIWTSDTMAYLTGKAIGKHKLFPSVSPGKTIEGSLGAGVCSLLVGLGFAFFLGESYPKWIILALVVWILGTLGDLVESRLKRVQNVKDSGSILPGHGGFLDRFDSLVLLIPFLLLLEYHFRA
jgi:phosphatidate cytidylyltransferase